MAFFSLFVSLIMFSMVNSSFSEGEASLRGCTFFKWPFTALCELGTVWGVVVPVGVGGAALVSLILALLLLSRLTRNIEAERRSGVAPLLLMLTSIFGLCGLSTVYLTEEGQHACIYRYASLAALFVPCLACLLAQGMRLHRLAQTTPSLFIGAMLGFTGLLAGTQGLTATLWVVVITINQGQLACRSRPLDFSMAFIYVLILLSAALSGVACSWFRKQQHSKCRVAWLLATWLTSAVLWAARLTFHVYANAALGLPSTWDDLEHALVLVVQAWLLLLLHAIPEAHTWLRLASQRSLQTPVVIVNGFSEEISLSSWPFGHIQGSWSDRSCSVWNTSFEAGPSTPFGSNESIAFTIPDEGEVSVASHSVPCTHRHTHSGLYGLEGHFSQTLPAEVYRDYPFLSS
nr:G-protein coupled receptor family C group 5 member D-like isoform X1 [Paramormyrops kingsleyae]